MSAPPLPAILPPPRAGLIKAPAYFWSAVTLLLATALVGVLVRVLPPAESHLYPPCLLHETTGLYCPGCGATRSVAALLTGHLLQAVTYNAFLPLIMPAVLAWWAGLLYQGLTARPLWTRPVPRWIPLALLLAFCLYGILRNLPFAPFTALVPHGG